MNWIQSILISRKKLSQTLYDRYCISGDLPNTKSQENSSASIVVLYVLFSLQLRKEDENTDVTKDWKFAAMVVDRLCLIIFTLFTLIATLAVLFSAPHFLFS